MAEGDNRDPCRTLKEITEQILDQTTQMENKREINNNELPTQKNQKQDGQEIKDQENKEHEVKDQEMTDQEMTEQQEKDLLDDSQADICVQLREITVNTPTKEDLEQGTKVSKNIKQTLMKV